MHKSIIKLLAITCVVCMLTGCGDNETQTTETQTSQEQTTQENANMSEDITSEQETASTELVSTEQTTEQTTEKEVVVTVVPAEGSHTPNTPADQQKPENSTSTEENIDEGANGDKYVCVLRSGTSYHYVNDCPGLGSGSVSWIKCSDAVERGYEKCDKCSSDVDDIESEKPEIEDDKEENKKEDKDDKNTSEEKPDDNNTSEEKPDKSESKVSNTWRNQVLTYTVDKDAWVIHKTNCSSINTDADFENVRSTLNYLISANQLGVCSTCLSENATHGDYEWESIIDAYRVDLATKKIHDYNCNCNIEKNKTVKSSISYLEQHNKLVRCNVCFGDTAQSNDTWINDNKNTDDKNTMIVYTTETGKKYHNHNNCGNTDPDKTQKMSKAIAIDKGYEECSNCF